MPHAKIMELFGTAAYNMHLALLKNDGYFYLDFISACMFNDLNGEMENFGWDGNNIHGFAFGDDVEWWQNRPRFWELMGY